MISLCLTFLKCDDLFHIIAYNRKAICMRTRQYGLEKCHGGILCVLFSFTSSIWSLFSRAESEVYWKCSTNVFLRYQGISMMKVTLL